MRFTLFLLQQVIKNNIRKQKFEKKRPIPVYKFLGRVHLPEWTFDCNFNPNLNPNSKPNSNPKAQKRFRENESDVIFRASIQIPSKFA